MKRLVALIPAVLLIAACSQSSGVGVAVPRPEQTSAAPAALDPVGTFDFQTEAMGSAVNGTFSITGSPGSYSGNMSTDMGGFSLRRISVNGHELSFLAESPDIFVIIALAFDGDAFTGRWDAEGMSGFISGKRR